MISKVIRKNFLSIISDITSHFNKIKKGDYLNYGEYPIIDQGKEFIAGYTNDESLVNKSDRPIIIFGDHTRIFKYVKFPIAIGADGVKVLKVNSNIYSHYVYYFLKSVKIHDAGYSRHYKFLKDLKIPIPEKLEDQIRIANVLSRAEALIAKRKESILLLDELLKSTFLDMFGDPVRNEKGWEKTELVNFGEIKTGNTPPRSNSENYAPKFIEWIKTDNITEDRIFISDAIEHLSKVGLSRARKVEKGALLVACIAGSIESVGRAALTNRTVSFNQQINAIQPQNDISPLFLYWLFKISRKYIQNHATKGMKKILTKGEFQKIMMIKPPYDLQNQFSQIVEKAENIKTKYQVSLQELENLYASLSQKAFKGELDLSKMEVKEYNLSHAEHGRSMAAEAGVGYKTKKS